MNELIAIREITLKREALANLYGKNIKILSLSIDRAKGDILFEEEKEEKGIIIFKILNGKKENIGHVIIVI